MDTRKKIELIKKKLTDFNENPTDTRRDEFIVLLSDTIVEMLYAIEILPRTPQNPQEEDLDAK